MTLMMKVSDWRAVSEARQLSDEIAAGEFCFSVAWRGHFYLYLETLTTTTGKKREKKMCVSWKKLEEFTY